MSTIPCFSDTDMSVPPGPSYEPRSESVSVAPYKAASLTDHDAGPRSGDAGTHVPFGVNQSTSHGGFSGMKLSLAAGSAVVLSLAVAATVAAQSASPSAEPSI